MIAFFVVVAVAVVVDFYFYKRYDVFVAVIVIVAVVVCCQVFLCFLQRAAPTLGALQLYRCSRIVFDVTVFRTTTGPATGVTHQFCPFGN